ncbi:MAG: DUF695 domain-containing protein [Pseudomonadota bacterium]
MDEQRVEIDIPKPQFTLLQVTRSGKPEILVLNAALVAFAHPPIFPWHLLVTLEAEELVANGMPSRPESEVLWRIGDEIEALVGSGKTPHGSDNAVFLARSTWDGCRELLFQVHDPEITHASLQQLLDSRDWERAWEYEMQDDPAWSKAAKLFQLLPRKE